jgi:hypothetical protein
MMDPLRLDGMKLVGRVHGIHVGDVKFNVEG